MHSNARGVAHPNLRWAIGFCFLLLGTSTLTILVATGYSRLGGNYKTANIALVVLLDLVVPLMALRFNEVLSKGLKSKGADTREDLLLYLIVLISIVTLSLLDSGVLSGNIILSMLVSSLTVVFSNFLSVSSNARKWTLSLAFLTLFLALGGLAFNGIALTQTTSSQDLVFKCAQGIFFYLVVIYAAYTLAEEFKIGHGGTAGIMGVTMGMAIGLEWFSFFLTATDHPHLSLEWPTGIVLAEIILIIPLITLFSEMRMKTLEKINQLEIAKIDLTPVARSTPATGLRAWKVNQVNSYSETGIVPIYALGSINDYLHKWLSKRQIAACVDNKEHLSPDPSCGCGLYALDSLKQIPGFGGHMISCTCCVVGLVIGWGIVCQHGTAGWRSQYQEIKALLDRSTKDKPDLLAHAVASQLKIPLMNEVQLKYFMNEG